MNKAPNQKLLKQLDQVELMRKTLLAEVQLLPLEIIQKTTIEGKWSILEIIEHLILGEDYVLAGLDDSSKLLPKKRTLLNYLRYLFVMSVLNSFFKVRVPTRKMNPISNSTLAELIERWEQNHQKLRDYLKLLNSETISDAVFIIRFPVHLPPSKLSTC